LVQSLDHYLFYIGFILGYFLIGAGTCYFAYLVYSNTRRKSRGNINQPIL